MAFRWLLLPVLAVLGVSLGCDRRVEDYDPDETPREPDLSRIFPAGAEQAARSETPLAPPPPPGMPPPPGALAARGEAVTSDAPPIRGTIRVAEELAGDVPDGATLFVIARPGSSGPPLAVLRVPSPRFPLDFSIGPENRMIQTLPFAGPLQLSARLDYDGNATTRNPGDLQGRAEGRYEPGARDVELVLSEKL